MEINRNSLILNDWSQSPRVCPNCVGDKDIRRKIVDLGYVGECAYCNTYDCNVIPVQLLSNWVAHVFSRDYVPRALNDSFSRPHFDWEGETAQNIFSEIVGGNPKFLEELHNAFQAQCRKKYIEAGLYSSEALYLPSVLDSLIHEWDGLCRELTHKTRFINKEIKSFLDSIFEQFKRLASNSGELIVVLPQRDSVIYHGRVVKDDNDIKNILENPEIMLGAPPRGLARSGRLNPAGVPVFYGALNEVTCLAEIRCPVGSKALVGAFRPVRDLRLLDLTAFESAFADIGHFNHDYEFLSSAAGFLRKLSEQFSQPVLPHEEELSYLPTQFLFEYISCLDYLNIDGIIFHSTQTGQDGKNVVLFNRVSGVKSSETKYIFKLEPNQDFPQINSYCFEPLHQIDIDKIETNDSNENDVEEVLFFDYKKASVYRINGVRYDFIDQKVSFSG